MDKSVVVLVSEIDPDTPHHPPDESFVSDPEPAVGDDLPEESDLDETPRSSELVLTYDGTSLSASIDGRPHAEGFEHQTQEASDIFDHPTSACVLHIPDLGYIPITRRQARDMNRKMIRFDERLAAADVPRERGRPPIDPHGTKQIPLTLPAHTVEALDTWAQQAGVKRGVYLRRLITGQVEYRTIREFQADLIDNPGWQEHAVDAWLEGAEEQGFGFHVIRTMNDQNHEIAIVRRDNWDNPDDATVGGREYTLTVQWPQGLAPEDYGKGTAEVIITAKERPLHAMI